MTTFEEDYKRIDVKIHELFGMYLEFYLKHKDRTDLTRGQQEELKTMKTILERNNLTTSRQ